MVAETPLPVGQVVELELALGARPPFPLLGRITWVNEPDAGRAPHLPRGYGVKITRIALEDKVTLLAALKDGRAVAGRETPGGEQPS